MAARLCSSDASLPSFVRWLHYSPGLNCMNWRRFLLFNALGAIVWVSAYGIGAYAFGQELTDALGKVGVVPGARRPQHEHG